jgi:hypothetical protein
VSNDKHFVVIGLSEEDEAHLRLLLRRAAIDHLSHRWRAGTEDQADLYVVDPTTFAGQMARGRAAGSGRRCAVFGNDELRDGELRLPRPMKLESVADLLNGVGAAAEFETVGAIIPSAQNFYDLEELSPPADEATPARPKSAQADEIEEIELNLESGEQREATPAEGLEELLRPDTPAAKGTTPFELRDAYMMESGHMLTARREKRVADAGGSVKRERNAGDLNLTTPSSLGPAHAEAPATLRDYLRGNLLGGPATLTLKNVPALSLDPKTRAFHTPAASLHDLAPYCQGTLPQRQWRALTTAELARLREEQPAQPYSRLIWLATLLQSGGRLASHLDPGGRYRLKDGVAIEADRPLHARIGDAMRALAKLNEIAAVSGASMAEVFNVVNAYEAIHAIETEKRQPRFTETPSSGGGLFSKLRKSLIGR